MRLSHNPARLLSNELDERSHSLFSRHADGEREIHSSLTPLEALGFSWSLRRHSENRPRCSNLGFHGISLSSLRCQQPLWGNDKRMVFPLLLRIWPGYFCGGTCTKSIKSFQTDLCFQDPFQPGRKNALTARFQVNMHLDSLGGLCHKMPEPLLFSVSAAVATSPITLIASPFYMST